MLSHFAVRARLFHTGTLCRHADFDAAEGHGYLHLLRSGHADFGDETGFRMRLDEPVLLFYARPLTHWIRPDIEQGADLACASVQFDHSAFNPIVRALPARVICPLSEMEESAALLDILFAEAFAERQGRQEVLNRLFELVLMQLLRHSLRSGRTSVGFLRGLAHPQLSRAITAMHAEPERQWTLESLAALAAMSRSSFAGAFRREVGQTPGEYLTCWRIASAQALLRRGMSLPHVAGRVGYLSQAGFQRAFRQVIGLPPGLWLRQAGPGPD